MLCLQIGFCSVLAAAMGISHASALAQSPNAGVSPASEPTLEDRIEDEVRGLRTSLYFRSGLPSGLPPTRDDQKVHYGKDDRKDIMVLNDKQPLERMARRLALSTCLLTSRSMLIPQANKTYRLSLKEFRRQGKPACPGEPFGSQKCGGWGSGFLVGEDLVATAGHCVIKGDPDASQTAFVFGFYAGPKDATPAEFSSDQVYHGKAVIKKEQSSKGDYALIRLDRKVTYRGAEPLRLRRKGSPQVGEKIGLIGYPSGLPAKAAYGQSTKIYEVQDVWLRTNLDAYGGNSGSVVTNEDGLVEGILVRGNPDYEFFDAPNPADDCFKSVELMDSQAGEIVTRASVFASEVPEPPAPRQP
jgi:hypothetical protein